MSVFSNATTSKKQGDIGEARAIYEYTRLGYTVSKPLCDSAKYDIVIEKNGTFSRVQVKTSTCIKPSGGYEVSLITCGGNKSGNTTHYLSTETSDIVFVLVDDGTAYSIPTTVICQFKRIVVGNKYKEYKIT